MRKVVSSKPRGNRGFTSGSGETQLELERRQLKDKLISLKRELADINVKKSKELKRIKNKNAVALIGYTNAGKTALLNCLAKVSLGSHDRLFETLKTTSKLVRIDSGQQVPFLDTIGFISRLPHELVDSFKSTLAEIKEANTLVHIRDISHPGTISQREVVLKVLKEIMGMDVEKGKVRYIEVLNKTDLLDPMLADETIKREREGKNYPVIGISTKSKTNIKNLMKILTNIVNEASGSKIITLQIRYADAEKKFKWLRANAEIYNDSIEHDETTGEMKVKVAIEEGMLKAYSHTFREK